MRLHSFGLTLLALMVIGPAVKANTKNDPHFPISHCYHWLTPSHLDYKYKYAQRNSGEITFYTTGGNGAVAGPGLYCAKSPSGSYSYGSRIVRLDLVDDIVLYDAMSGRKYCGHNGNFYGTQRECDKQPWDIKFYSGGGRGNAAWYVIRDPQAILAWSANSSVLSADLNMSKTLNGASFDQHADSTIQRMSKEIARDGSETVWDNPDARMDIIDLLNDPSKLNTIPPLAVIARVETSRSKKLTAKIKKDVITTQYKRALLDTLLGYDDYKKSLQSDELKDYFGDALSTVNFKNLQNYNSVALLLSAEEQLFKFTVSKQNIISLWKSSLFSESHIQDFVDFDFDKSANVIDLFESSLPYPQTLVNSVKPKNLGSLLIFLDKHFTGKRSVGTGKAYSEAIMQAMSKNSYELLATYGKIQNTKLDKNAAVVSILSKSYNNRFKELSPLITASLIEKLDKNLSSTTKNKYISMIESSPIPSTDKESYILLDDLAEGRLEVPSILDRDNFLIKIVEKSIAERVDGKPTANTFRVIFSGLYHYFSNQIKKAQDDAAIKLVKAEAGEMFLKLASSLKGDLAYSYRYIAAQNAAYFLGKKRYDDHPMESLLAMYKTGDNSFDVLLEDITKTSTDGTYLHFLLNNSKDPKASSLLSMNVNSLLSSGFSSYLTSDEFEISNDQKKSWSNIIFNDRYTSGSSRVDSHICQVSYVINAQGKAFSKAIGAKNTSLLKTLGTDIYNNHCK